MSSHLANFISTLSLMANWFSLMAAEVYQEIPPIFIYIYIYIYIYKSIAFYDNIKIASAAAPSHEATFFILDFNLPSYELDSFTFSLLCWVILYWHNV